MLEELKKHYDTIIIDTGSDSKCFEIVKILAKITDKTICLVEGNLISVRKNMNLLSDLGVDKEKVNIIYNKKSKYSMKSKLLEMVFLKYKMLGSLSYDNKYNHIINKNINKLYITKKIKREFEKIINEVTNLEENLGEEQNKFLESTFGKVVNTGIDIALRAILPNSIEDEIIRNKRHYNNRRI